MIREISSDEENNLIELTPIVSIVILLGMKRKCVEILKLLIQNAPNNQEKTPAKKIFLQKACFLSIILY